MRALGSICDTTSTLYVTKRNSVFPDVSYQMSPSEIVCAVKQVDPSCFAFLTPQVVGSWIDRTAKPRWSDETLAHVARGNLPRNQTTRQTILSNHPDVVKMITANLLALRRVGVALDTPCCRGLILAHLQYSAPEIFETVAKDGSRFRCTESWVKKFVHEQLNWSFRRATRAAQKLPINVDELLLDQFQCLTLTIRDCAIFHPCFLVNINQTQIVYQPANMATYEEISSKQVSVIGQEEKRAFTCVNGISAAGDVMKIYLVFEGKSTHSLPCTTTPQYQEFIRLGFKAVVANTHTYWATFETMCDYVANILVPYWNEQKIPVGAPDDQECILQLNVWSVHRSVQFRTWLDQTYPWIKYRFVPGNCTGVGQPCDVSIQRPFKLAVKRSQHADIVNESLALLEKNQPSLVRLDTTVSTLHDGVIQWVIDGYHAVNRPEIVKQV